MAGCQSAPQSPKARTITISADITLHPLAEGVWVHTTWFDLPDYGRCPANGLLVVDGPEALLIDLPWTNELTATLCDWITRNLKATVQTVIPTHFHQDCMGGLAEAQRRGALSYASDKTIALAWQKGLPVPQVPCRSQTLIRCGTTLVLVTHPGAGHTTDNVIAWLPVQKILFGGCLIKSMDSASLGNTQDGDPAAYPATLRKVQAAYPEARIVVPGHGRWGGPGLIGHTLGLCSERASNPGE
ncbi:MAG: subclass B1 metallo-beta-lactamase [Planctomycetes bacterium]|nr:subclass B1 metallo-beta-lactamase [Planctomycetota bacterium]